VPDKIVLLVRFRAKLGMKASFLDRLNQLVQTIRLERAFEDWRQAIGTWARTCVLLKQPTAWRKTNESSFVFEDILDCRGCGCC
jgi:hypothetical protein